MRRVLLPATLLLILVLPRSLAAWGAQGHHLVARIAWALLAPPTRTAVQSLLGDGMDAFVSASTWADDVRATRPETANWHFVDIPLGSAHYDASRDCRPSDRGDCVIAEIARARRDLADTSRSTEQRAESLKFIIHFVGDLHQPLHAVDNHDRGGNDVHVSSLRDGPAGRATNLHAAWDTGVINLSTETEAARAARLLADLQIHPVDSALDPVAWAEESHAAAVRDVYTYPGFSSAGPPKDAVTLDTAYLQRAVATIDRRLEAAGARLAALLNSILGK